MEGKINTVFQQPSSYLAVGHVSYSIVIIFNRHHDISDD